MASVKFRVLHNSNTAQIYIRFSISRDNVFQMKTGLIINSNDWSNEKAFPKQNSSQNKQISAQLKDLESFVLNSYNSDYSNGVQFSKSWFDNKINSFFKRNEEKEAIIQSEDNTALNYLLEYIEFKKSISTTRIDKIRKLNNLKDRFTNYQVKKKKKFLLNEVSGKVLIDFKDYLIHDCNMMSSTASRFIKDFKTVLFDAQSNGKDINHQVKGFSTGNTNSEHKIYLSFREIEQIKTKELENKDWALAKDWLILGCFLGQRASDLLRMTKKMIYTKTDSDGESFRFLEITQQKTGEIVVIPLHEEVETILKKYNGDFPPVFTSNPDSNVALFNRFLKKVCEASGITEVVKGKVFNDDTKKNDIVDTEKCFIISSHACRRSFATNFYGNKNFTTPQLMAITGHKSESQFLNYIGRTADDWAMQTAKTFKEISKNRN